MSFGKIYHYRDHEKILTCFLPMFGYNNPNILQIVKKRIETLYNFTKNESYDIYIDGSKLKGVSKDWQKYIINPQLYQGGHISLPDMHDFILLHGIYDYLNENEKIKIEKIASWIINDRFRSIYRRYGYFYLQGGSYNSKAIIFKPYLVDFNNPFLDKQEYTSLLFTTFIMSKFKIIRNSNWFDMSLNYLQSFKNENGRYVFPTHMITEKRDTYVINGGHMNIGESKKSKKYAEIISTFWMQRIFQNIKE